MAGLSSFLTALNVAGNVANTIGTFAGAAKNIAGTFGGWGRGATAKARAEAQARAVDIPKAEARPEQTSNK